MHSPDYQPPDRATTSTDLEESKGTLYLVTEDAAGNRERTDLGPIEDASWDVPAALLDRYDDLLTDWRYAAEFGAACRAEIEATYRRTKGF
jgi:hypothetical protein